MREPEKGDWHRVGDISHGFSIYRDSEPVPIFHSTFTVLQRNEKSPEGRSVNKLPTVSCGCRGPAMADTAQHDAAWITGSVDTSVGQVPCVDTTLHWADRIGAWKARWAIGRMRFTIEPALYAVGDPTAESLVMVSANYKLSFDRLRSQLAEIDAWILVLDTRGINVWCAAGKGTFGTDELVARIEATGLHDVVSHRTLVVPQLGAPGVAAHEVKKQSGFRVLYGPVRAEDLPAYLDAGMTATDEMRRVRFPLGARLAVIPVELVMAAKYVLIVAACFLLAGGLGSDGYSWSHVIDAGFWSAALLLGATVLSVILTPALLPWLPGRAFSIKGVWVGLAVLLAVLGHGWYHGGPLGRAFEGPWNLAAWCLLIPASASFFAMNFTGATTYTSLSGVRKEMALAVPLQALGALTGTVCWLVGRFA